MNITLKDPNQITAHEHDETLNAKRVYIVNHEDWNNKSIIQEANNNHILYSGETKYQTIEVPVIVKELEIKEIEKQVIVIQKELQVERIEIPIVVEKIVEVIKEVPVIQTEVQIIEKPVIIKEFEYKDLPTWIKIGLAVQILVSIISLLKK